MTPAEGKRPVCLVAAEMVAANLRLQPWRGLSEIACGLGREGHSVTVVTDATTVDGKDEWPGGVHLARIRSVRSPRQGRNRALTTAIEDSDAEVIVWHVGLTSLLHQRFDVTAGRPVIGFLTSPIYGRQELAGIGPGRLLRHYRSTLLPIAGALAPAAALRRCLVRGDVRALVVQTGTTAAQVRARGVWDGLLAVIPPGVDHCWCRPLEAAVVRRRAELGFEEGDYVIAYFGSPAPLRGLPVLVQAFARARTERPRLRLLVLSRRRPGELAREAARLDALIRSAGVAPHVRVVDGALRPAALAEHLAVADLVALPFELVPSDAPLSIGEALALGKPVLTTRVACLPELAAAGRHILVPPGDIPALSAALVQAADGGGDWSSPGAPPGPTLELRPWAAVGRAWSQLVEGL